MNFKSYTKDTYTLITASDAALDGNVAAALLDECTALAESGSQNFIVDLAACQTADPAALDTLAALHESCYSQEQSLVLLAATPAVARALRESGAAEVLNLAPTMAEAVDIVSMEILERDLLRE